MSDQSCGNLAPQVIFGLHDGAMSILGVERVHEAECCAEAGCYPAACAMAGAGTEAAIMAHVSVSAT